MEYWVQMIKFDNKISRKGTYCTQWDYIEDRFNVKDIIPFSISDMDIAVPSTIIKKLKERLSHPILGYSRWRNSDYLTAIEQWYQKRYQCQINQKWILYSPSVMYSISILIQQLSDVGDDIVIMTPAYNAFFEVIKNNGRNIIESPLILKNKKYEIDYADLEEKCRFSKVLLWCNPHNPIGRVWSESEMSKVLEIAKKNSCWIISDDIHMDLSIYKKPYCILKKLNDYNNMIVVNSISKAFNVPALSGSYMIIPDENLYKQIENKTRYTDFVNSPAILNVIATIEAYNECELWLDNLRVYLRGNIEYVDDFLKKNCDKISLIKPEGTYLCWLDCRQLNLSDNQIQQNLIEKGGIGIMPGKVYGAQEQGFLRFHVGCPREKVKIGMERIKYSLQD